MKHLVLGSEGQIGSYVCDFIEDKGEELIRWDIGLDDSYDLRLDINLRLKEAMAQSDFVHFLAYNVGGSKYLEKNQSELSYISDNMKIMDNTFQALKETGTPFYFASSQMSNMEDSVYGSLKKLGEHYTQALGGTIVKFWNVYGRESNLEKAHVITDFIKMAVETGEIKCRTDGQELRHFTYGDDAAKMLWFIADKFVDTKTPVLRPINVVNHDQPWSSIREVANLIGKILNTKYDRSIEIYYRDKKDSTQTIHNEFYHSSMMDCLENFISLEEGIEILIEHYMKQ